jgi:hypothetical protein
MRIGRWCLERAGASRPRYLMRDPYKHPPTSGVEVSGTGGIEGNENPRLPHLSRQPGIFTMGRVGLEPTTIRLKAECSTS